MPTLWTLLGLSALMALCACPRAEAGRGDLRQIVQQRCLPNWQQRRDPAPCLAVTLPGDGSTDRGYAVLQDRKGGAHLLLIPLRTLEGIESPELLQAGALPNFFAAAWQAQALLAAHTGYPLARDDVALAINSRYSRGQDQLHIHIECQGMALHAALLAHAAALTESWRPLVVDGNEWLVRRVAGSALARRDPFQLLATGVPAARESMARYTLVVAGVQYRDGPGFALLTRRAILRGGEALLDASCAVAAQPPLR